MNFLKKNLPKNKNVLFFALVVIFVSLELAFPQPASAGVITSVLLALPGILLALLGFFTNLFAQLAIVVFNWVTSPTFIDWSYTQNPVIEVGLGITKQFVNMGLVVVLIFIALAIALQIKEYGSKKTLIRLIAVALLVNFAPVICGLIVDAANIVMNYFLSPIKEGVNSILGGIKGSFAIFSEIMSIRKDPSEQLGLFGRLGVSLIFNAVIGFTFFLLAVIFIVRYLAIWILVILAPLAFVAWILPATKKFWDQWWQQLIQWSIIGIPIAFFLYLAMASLGAMRIQFENKMPMAGLAPEVSMGGNYFNEFFGYMIVIIMIWLGIIIGLQTSATGATGIMNFAKSKGKAGAKWAAKRIPEGTAAATAGAFRGLGKGIKEGKGLGRITGAATGAFKGAATYEGREKGREVMGRALEKAHLLRPGAYETARRKRWKIEEETKRLDTLPTDRLQDISERKAITPAEKRAQVAAVEVLAKRGTIGGPEGSEREKKMRQLLPKMQSLGADIKQILKVRPDLAPLVDKDTSKVVAGTSREDSIKFQAEALKNIDVIMSLDIPKIEYISIRGDAEKRRALKETARQDTTTFNEMEKKINDLLAKGTLEAKKEAERIVDVIDKIQTDLNIQSS